MKWYEKYLSVYGKPYAGVPAEVMDGIRNRLRTLQSDEPLVSVVVIAYNEEKHLPACLWSLSESVCEYPMEIIGVNNDSADRTADVFEASGIPYHTELQHSCGYARRCGLNLEKRRPFSNADMASSCAASAKRASRRACSYTSAAWSARSRIKSASLACGKRFSLRWFKRYSP